ncbi:MAG TPA: hypothetical protein VFO35_12170 [Steroidobacteraceae bacterium]|nr:hypothetical protein [Steroidobacteraceae bacterium]
MPLRDFLRLADGQTRLESFEQARRFYVEYHALLCEAGVYSCAGILLSAARALVKPSLSVAAAGCTDVVVFDGCSASGLRTVADLGLAPLLDIRPQSFLGYLDNRARWRFATRLAGAVCAPRHFFALLFDAYASVTQVVLEGSPACNSVLAANERSLGCAPFLVAAKFLHKRQATVVQHGNPIGDYLPTLADEYWCRSDRWFDYLQTHALVRRLRRVSDFPVLNGIDYDPDRRRAVLVMHNVGYLEPNLDYGQLSSKIKAACARAGWTLHVLQHPANRESYGLPVVDRRAAFKAAFAIGYRSTATDQLTREMPRVSLLDYWPDFFLRQGRPEQLDDYMQRIGEALT